jgi:hypothetical protein
MNISSSSSVSGGGGLGGGTSPLGNGGRGGAISAERTFILKLKFLKFSKHKVIRYNYLLSLISFSLFYIIYSSLIITL